MRTDYGQVFQDTSAVDKYERVVYAPDSHSSAVHARQRRYLRRLVVRAFPDRPPVQHDFACGTGRGVKLLRGLVREAHGYDPSAALLGRHGFTLVAGYGCAVLPQGAYRLRPLRPLVRRLDDLLCRLGWLSRYATDVLYVARRTTTVGAQEH